MTPHIEKAAIDLLVLHGWTEELARAEIASGSLCGKDRIAEATLVWSLARAHTIEEAAKDACDRWEYIRADYTDGATIEVLNELGALGWELCWRNHASHTFKRRIRTLATSSATQPEKPTEG